MKTKLLTLFTGILPLQTNCLGINTDKGQFCIGKYVSFSGILYSCEQRIPLYWFGGVICEGDTISLDLTDGDAMMRSIYSKAIHTRNALSFVMNEYIEVDKFEYKESEIDTSHYDLCSYGNDGIATEVAFDLDSGERVSLYYCTTLGVYYFAPYPELKNYCLSIDYFHLDNLLGASDVCVPLSIVSESKCDYKVFY